MYHKQLRGRGSIIVICTSVLAIISTTSAFAAPGDHDGPYSQGDESDHTIDPAIPYDDSTIKAWATGCSSYYRSDGETGYSDVNQAIGTAGTSVYDIVSLGDLSATAITNNDPVGHITLSFDVTIANGEGFDLAVYENGMANDYCELAFVEVSTDGIEFARFNNTYYGAATAPVGGYAFIDATYIYNLAGKHAVGYGTPFDLEELVSHPQVIGGLVDLNDIHYVRIVDIPGSGDWTDDSGNPIYDAWLTYGSGGADIDGVAVLNVLTDTNDDITLQASPPQGVVGDPGSAVTITSDIIYLPGDIPVTDGTMFTVVTTLGTITSADEDTGTDGIQISSSSGTITFTLQGNTFAGKAQISAISTDELLYGEINYLFCAGTAVTPVEIILLNPNATAPGPIVFTTTTIMDSWGNPLDEGTHVTLVVTGGTPVDADAVPEEQGHQLTLNTGIADFRILVDTEKSGETATLTVALYAEPEQSTLLGEETVMLEIVQMPFRLTGLLALALLCTAVPFLFHKKGRKRLL